MLLSILSNLMAKTKYSLTRIRRIFPAENSPKDGVPALVALFELSLESARQLQSEFPSVFSTHLQARQFASNLTTEATCDLLASYVKVIFNHDECFFETTDNYRLIIQNNENVVCVCCNLQCVVVKQKNTKASWYK